MRSHAIPFRITYTLLCRHALRWVALSLLLLLGHVVPTIAGDVACVAERDTARIQCFPIGPSDGALGQPTSQPLPAGLYPLTIKFSPEGNNAYVMTEGRPGAGSWLLWYALNRTTGALTPQGNVPATLGTGGLAISEKFVCTAHAGGSPALPTAPSYAISCFARDPQSGALRLVDTFDLKTRPADLTFDSTGQFLYVTLSLRHEVGQLRLNTTTGKLSWLQPPTVSAGENPVPIVRNPIYPIVYEGNTGHQGTVRSFSINPNGTLTARWVTQVGLYPAAMAVDNSGKFLVVVNATSNDVMGINASTGQLLDKKSAGASPEDVAFGPVLPDGQVVYTVNRGSSNVSRFTIQKGTGLLTLRGISAAPTHPVSIATTSQLSQ